MLRVFQIMDTKTYKVNRLSLTASHCQSFARKLVRPLGDLTEKDVQNELRAIKKLCEDNSHLNLVFVFGHGQFFDAKSQLSWFYIDMELCDFDLHDAIQDRQLLSHTRTPNPAKREAERKSWNV